METNRFQAAMNTAYPAHLCTTFAQLRAADACASGYRKVAEAIRDNFACTPEAWGDRPIPVAAIMESNDWADAMWTLRNAVPRGPEWLRFMRTLACDYAAEVLPIWEKRYPEDKRVANCIEAARRFIDGEISEDELRAARRQACAADAYAAAAAADAAAAAYAADADAYAADAADAAYAAYAADAYAADAAYAAYAADAAADAADAAAYAADAAAYAAAAYAAARIALKNRVLAASLEAERGAAAAKAVKAAAEPCIASSDVPY